MVVVVSYLLQGEGLANPPRYLSWTVALTLSLGLWADILALVQFVA